MELILILFGKCQLKWIFFFESVFSVRPGPNNTVIIVIITNGTAPNITIANVLNITTEPTKSIWLKTIENEIEQVYL